MLGLLHASAISQFALATAALFVQHNQLAHLCKVRSKLLIGGQSLVVIQGGVANLSSSGVMPWSGGLRGADLKGEVMWRGPLPWPS